MSRTATYALIASQTLGSATTTVTFSSIPGTYTDLILICNARSATAAVSDTYLMTLNGDTGNNYSRTRLLGNGSTATTANRSSAPNIDFEGMAGANASAGTFMTARIQLQDYSNTATHKTSLIRGDDANNYVLTTVGLWRSTSAITSITLVTSSGAQFATGSTFKLYGIEAGNA